MDARISGRVTSSSGSSSTIAQNLPSSEWNKSSNSPSSDCSKSLPTGECLTSSVSSKSDSSPSSECNKSNSTPSSECNRSDRSPSSECNKSDSSPSSECLKFEVHLFKRSILCKNCSKTRDQHLENGMKTEEGSGKMMEGSGKMKGGIEKRKGEVEKDDEGKIERRRVSSSEGSSKTIRHVNKEKPVEGHENRRPRSDFGSRRPRSVETITRKKDNKSIDVGLKSEEVGHKKFKTEPEIKIKPEVKICKTSKANSVKLVRSQSAESSKVKIQRSSSSDSDLVRLHGMKRVVMTSSGSIQTGSSDRKFKPEAQTGSSESTGSKVVKKIERSLSLENNDVTGEKEKKRIIEGKKSKEADTITRQPGLITRQTKQSDLITRLGRKIPKKPYSGKAEADILSGETVNPQDESRSFDSRSYRECVSDMRNVNADGEEMCRGEDGREREDRGEWKKSKKLYSDEIGSEERIENWKMRGRGKGGEIEGRAGGVEEMEGTIDGCQYKSRNDFRMGDILEHKKNIENEVCYASGLSTGQSFPGQPQEALAAIVAASGGQNCKTIVRELPCTTTLAAAAESRGREGDVGARCKRILGSVPAADEVIQGKSVSISRNAAEDMSGTDGVGMLTKSYQHSNAAAPATGAAGVDGEQQDLCNENEAENKKFKLIDRDVVSRPEVAIKYQPEVVSNSDDDDDNLSIIERSHHRLKSISNFKSRDVIHGDFDCLASTNIKEHCDVTEPEVDSSRLKNLNLDLDCGNKECQQRYQNRSIDIKNNYYLNNLNIPNYEDFLHEMTSPSSNSEFEDTSNDESDDVSRKKCLEHLGIRMSYDGDDDDGEYHVTDVFGQKMLDKLLDKNNFLESECEKFVREKTVLAELLAKKKKVPTATLR